jgi:hypothetical protein
MPTVSPADMSQHAIPILRAGSRASAAAIACALGYTSDNDSGVVEILEGRGASTDLSIVRVPNFNH